MGGEEGRKEGNRKSRIKIGGREERKEINV